MSVAAIVETLAREFSVDRAHAQRVHELLVAGHKAPYVARYRRAEIGPFTDGTIRRFARRLKQLEELDRRRNTLLRTIEELARSEGREGPIEPPPGVLECMDRFELEDLFLPHRRPEPEVQLAIDRGLEPLADLLVAPAPKHLLEREEDGAPEKNEREPVPEPTYETVEAALASAPVHESEAPVHGSEAPVHGSEDPVAGSAGSPDEEHAGPTGDETAHEELSVPEPPEQHEQHEEPPADEAPAPRPAFHPARIDLSPQLARVCAPFVNPDRGVHTDEQALEGAMRILSDRLGRSPELRTLLRRILRRHGTVTVRPLVDEQRLGRVRALLRLRAPLKQLQGHRLIALRQAQAQRLIAMAINVDEAQVFSRVRAALGKRIHPDHVSVANEVARQALHLRLLPMIEDDVRNELRERADEEAIRMLAQHLRQILLTPPAGPRPAAGVHVDARGDWTIVVVGAEGAPQGAEIKIEASTLSPTDLGQRLADALGNSGVWALVLGHGKSSRAALQKLREALHLRGADVSAFLVNEAGLSGYANSELARSELAEYSVPAREAVSLARRYQDPLQELLKVEPRHLGLGREQLVVSKANLRRVIHDTVESCVAHVGCDLNRSSISFLRHVPGLNYDLAKKLVERRTQRPFTSREELRTERLLDDVTWIDAIGFLRVPESSEPLDRTALHPEQYDLARRVILQGGGSVEETLGHRDATKGLRRADFDLDEATWRDLVREISHPGRDPRVRLHVPRLLPPDLDPKTLQKDQVVEGLVSNVASFGAFVDLGTPRDAMIHISEISDHYVRDARALLSIGQMVRARVVEAGGPRVELSLKNLPDFRRTGEDSRWRGERGERQERRGRRSRPERTEGESSWPDYQPVLRAARSRRDGLITGGREERRKGRGGRDENRPRTGGGGRRRGGGAPREDHYDADAVRRASHAAGSYNPFASFFKEREGESPGADSAAPPPQEARETGGEELERGAPE